MQSNLEAIMNEFLKVSSKKYDGYSYPCGYFMSMLQLIVKDDAEKTAKLIRQLSIQMEEYKQT